MSAAAVAAVYQLAGLPLASKSLLNAIADSADDDGVCNPSLAHLSRKVGLTDRHVRRVFKALVEQGFIHVSPREGFTNLLRLTPYVGWSTLTSSVSTIPVKEKGKPGRPAKNAQPAKKELGVSAIATDSATPKPVEVLRNVTLRAPRRAKPDAELVATALVAPPSVVERPLYDRKALPEQASFALELSPSMLDVEPEALVLDPFLLPLKSRHGTLDLRSRVTEFQSSYPKLDVDAELRKAVAWARANPRKRKTRAGVEKHLVTWLNGAAEAAAKRPPQRPVSSHLLDHANINYKKTLEARGDFRF